MRPRHPALALVALTAALTACEARRTTAPPVPANLDRVSGHGQTGVAGQALTQPLVVAVTSATGAGVAGVTVSWAATAGKGAVSAPSTTTDAQGHASVSLTLGPQAGASVDTVTASVAGLTGSPVVFAASATAGPATQLVLVSGDHQADTVGHVLADSLVASPRDLFGNPAPGIVVTWAVTSGGGTLSAGSSVADAVGRSAVRWTLGDSVGTQHAAASLTGIGTPLVFTATGLAAPNTHLAFTVEPTSVTAGSAITPAIEVRALNGSGGTETTFTDDVTLGLGTNPSGGALSGTVTVAAVAGVATFSNVSLDKVGAGYTLIASTASLASVTSTAFSVTPGSATQLAFTAQPASTTAGATLSTIQVTARDAFGNTAIAFAGDVTVALGANPGSATLSGTTTVTAVAGIASFANLSLDRPGTGYTLIASAPGVASDTSASFDIAPGSATQLAFTVQPSTTDTGAAITPAVGVTARDALGNTATAFTGNVTIAISTNPAGGTLSGTTSTAASAGVVTFANLHIDKAGAGYTLQASAGGLAAATSASFDITVPPPAGSVVVAAGDGQSGLQGYALNVAPAVLVRDTLNAPLAGVPVTFAIASGGGGVTGATTTTDANGIATVGAWSVQLGGNTLTATVGAAGITGNPVTFTATGVAAAYTIDVRFLTPMTPSQQAAFTNAAAKWETLIYGDVPDFTLNNVPAGTCGAGTPALNETIDDIVIFAAIDSIDGPGKILGQAGPCLIRPSGLLPIVGVMMFDSADVAGLETAGEFGEVILHEMGHVLGYGTIWNGLSLLVGGGTSDPHFVGTQAIAAFDANGGQSYTAGAKVPVENCVGFQPGVCGAGTQDAHWRESVFDTELMTGFLNSGVPNPLSVITTASMGDLGYTVNYAASDPYTVANPLAALRARGGPLIELRDDILRLPLFSVDAAGHVVDGHPPH